MTENSLMVGLAQRLPEPIEDSLPGFREDVAATMAAHPEIRLLTYPEMHLCGIDHLPDAEQQHALRGGAVSLDSDYVRELGAIAAEHKIWLCPGSIGELDADGSFYNTQLIFDPAGMLRASYRKIFPWRPFELHRSGSEFVVQDLDGEAKVGLSICYDAWFPEHTRQLAWLGADVVLNIVKTTTPDREQELVIARANAIVNQNTMVSVNCAAPVGRGRSIVVDPEGFVLAEAGLDEQTLVVPVSPARAAKVRRDGTLGTNRLWHQFTAADDPVPLPMYAGRIDPTKWTPPGSETDPAA